MSSLATNGSSQLEFMRSFYQAIEQKDEDRIRKHLHKDSSYNLHPRSLGMPKQTGEEWLKNFGEFMSLWDGNGKASNHRSYTNLLSRLTPPTVNLPFRRRSPGSGRHSCSYLRLCSV